MSRKIDIAKQANYLIGQLREYKTESGGDFLKTTLHNSLLFLREINATGDPEKLIEDLQSMVANNEKVPDQKIDELIGTLREVSQIMVAMQAHNRKEAAGEN